MGNWKSKPSSSDATTGCLDPSVLPTNHKRNGVLEEDGHQKHQPSTKNLPVPKHMLWGAETVEEHYEMIDEALELIQDKHGEDGLAALHLEFKMWHNPAHCKCQIMVEKGQQTPIAAADANTNTPSANNQRPSLYDTQQSMAESSLGNDDRDDEDDDAFFQGDLDATDIDSDPHKDGIQMDDLQDGYDVNKTLRRKNTSSGLSDDVSSYEDNHLSVSYMAPLKGLNDTIRNMPREDSITDLRGFGSAQTQQRESERSATTMFSLATHHTQTSSVVQQTDHQLQHHLLCQMRLWHSQLNIPITEQNHPHFLAHGKLYDEVARLCMEAAQDRMIAKGNLEWADVNVQSKLQANPVGSPANDHNENASPRMLMSTGWLPSQQSGEHMNSNKTLIIITGKGLVRSGIFSRRHLITTGMDAATSMAFVEGAKDRGMKIAVLDPNAEGPQAAMKIVQDSLDQILATADDAEEFYIVAHSMAGSQLARHLLHQAQRTGRSATKPTLLSRIKAIAFTDSNHNIQWTKNHDDITALLEGPSAVYFKSHKQHDETKRLGELQTNDCQFWKHRFGTIKTVWAGTSEHALTNYTAREYIWDHFDSIMEGYDDS